jgi:hypothetical protein
LASLPVWQQRLFCQFDQIADDLTIWKAFRSKRWLDIISDGGLSQSVGTFGWKVVDRAKSTLFQGSGPIDGPTEVGSSTRSELGGFTAPLVLIQAISQYWGLKHRCKFYWIVDSKAAMAKVKMYSQRGENMKYPDNSDYVSVIRNIIRNLRRPIRHVWVKGHQDDRKAYNDLDYAAQQNVDVDSLATDYFKFWAQATHALDPTYRRSTHLTHYQRYEISWKPGGKPSLAHKRIISKTLLTKT